MAQVANQTIERSETVQPKCLLCGSPCKRGRSGPASKYCSQECRYRFREKVLPPPWTCEYCGKQFSDRCRRFCNAECRHRKRYSTRTSAVGSKKCKRCQKQLTVQQEQQQEFCSLSCASISNAAKHGKIVGLTCLHCGKPFGHKPRQKNFCCFSCHKEFNGFKTVTNPKARESNRRAASRRRALKRGANVVKYKESDVFERDGYRCRLCKKMTDKTKMAPDPKAPTIDHIMPIAKGGADEPNNVQCACFRCNAKKSNKLGYHMFLSLDWGF